MHDRSQNQQRNHCFDISRNAANLKLDKRWGQWRNMLPTTRGDPLVELGGATSERTKHEAFSHPTGSRFENVKIGLLVGLRITKDLPHSQERRTYSAASCIP